MLLHTYHAAQHGHQKIVRIVDTNVVVLAVSMAQRLQPEDELLVALGTGKGFRFLAAHKVSAGLGPEKARALPRSRVFLDQEWGGRVQDILDF